MSSDNLDNDKHSSFEDLLEMDNSVSKHHKNLRAVATEMFKEYNNTSPEIMQKNVQLKKDNIIWEIKWVLKLLMLKMIIRLEGLQIY